MTEPVTWECTGCGESWLSSPDYAFHTCKNPRRCPGCGVLPHYEHDDGCDVARCQETGFQRLTCHEDHACGHDIWTGEWPGVAECIEFGWFQPDGHADLNRLYAESMDSPPSVRWSRCAARFVRAPSTT